MWSFNADLEDAWQAAWMDVEDYINELELVLKECRKKEKCLQSEAGLNFKQYQGVRSRAHKAAEDTAEIQQQLEEHQATFASAQKPLATESLEESL